MSIQRRMAKIQPFPGKPGMPESEKQSAQQDPSEMLSDVTTRRTAHEIFTNVEKNAHDELKRSSRALAFSGLAGGFGMGLTGLGVATVHAALGDAKSAEFVSLLF